MEKEAKLTFKVGELIESRSFLHGYRGAWFRCKITDIPKSKELTYELEYYDFPDEKKEKSKAYQDAPYCLGKSRKRRKELMLRPPYPTIYKESEMPDAGEISDVAVVVNDTWRVGELVDWRNTECFWSGRIIELCGDGKAQIELLPPPVGEGDIYDVLLKDVRPSLDWSPIHGWRVPTQDGNAGRPCARLVGPNTIAQVKYIETERSAGSSSANKLAVSSPLSSNSAATATSDEVKSTGTTGMPKKRPLINTVHEESNKLETIKIQDCGDITEAVFDCSCHLKKLNTGKGVTLNSMHSDSVEAAVLDLEEYLNKVKWLKEVLLCGILFDEPKTPQWEFVDKRAAASSKPRLPP